MKYSAPFLFVMALLLIMTPMTMQAQSMASRTSGQILLQVEEHGEAWYVDPVREERIYVQNGEAAYQIMRELGLGISNADLDMIPVGLTDYITWDTDADELYDTLEESIGTELSMRDTDGDGFSDYEEVLYGYDPIGPGMKEIDEELTNRLLGRIVLQVEEKGQAWYIHPGTEKRYYLPNGDAAYEIMRTLSLGISNADLEMIESFDLGSDCGTDIHCFRDRMSEGKYATVTYSATIDFLGYELMQTSKLMHSYLGTNGLYTYKTTSLHQTLDGEIVEEAIGVVQECLHNDLDQMLYVIDEMIIGNMSTSSMDFAVTCEIY